VRAYHEELWERLGEDRRPPHLPLRLRFLAQQLPGRERVLDLGCGDGLLSAAIAAQGAEVVGADVAEAALARARVRCPEVTFVRVPVDGPLPFADASFELVWASEVIEHVADTAAWLSEVRRVLAPGGTLALTTPAHSRLHVLLGGVERYSDPLGDHLHLYTRRSLRALLRELGFDEIQVRAAAGLPGLRALLLASARRPPLRLAGLAAGVARAPRASA
jgi:SAM-dependent methyltransferase